MQVGEHIKDKTTILTFDASSPEDGKRRKAWHGETFPGPAKPQKTQGWARILMGKKTAVFLPPQASQPLQRMF